ncbi:hypothetical protein [Kangiella koreensis]|uniref:Uncharacterized protein n=1 Tax=Kangiella koreensis (strain DSM 16069 / JCM 12317 / KCTC 12182 / SW-125) TaxID=523791 RepID=C7R5Q4_KANKD|nr:hypothetical protein [Kangiella koreensis]ACV27228.1 hypothetical protein Kkor_1816 [Kangiella koreensis DSM 16069]
MKQNNCAETVDRMQRGVAWGMLLCGITYLFIIAEELTPKGTLNNVLDMITMGGVVITMAVTLVAMWPALKQKLGGQLIGPKEPEGFVSGAMLVSFKNGWIVTTLSITILLSFSSRLELLELPLRFYFTSLFAIAVLSASLSFFWLTREDDLENMEE